MNENRPHFIERVAPARTPEEAQQRRSATMIGGGVVALLIGALALASGNAVGLLLGILGAALLVGGLVIRR